MKSRNRVRRAVSQTIAIVAAAGLGAFARTHEAAAGDDPFADPLTRLEEGLAANFHSPDLVSKLSARDKCSLEYLKSQGFTLLKSPDGRKADSGVPCHAGFQPSAVFASEGELRTNLETLLKGTQVRCLYQLRVEAAVKRAAKLMGENSKIEFNTASGKFERQPDNTYRTTGSFFSCQASPNGTRPFTADPYVPWGCVARDPCTSVQVFLSGTQKVGMDCANAVQANQYVYTYLKFDFDGNGTLDERECRLFTAAYEDATWEFTPFNFSEMTKNPFQGRDVKLPKTTPTGQDLAKRGAPYLAGVRAVITMKDTDLKTAKDHLGKSGAALVQRLKELRQRQQDSGLTVNERAELRQLDDKIQKSNYLNENLLITGASEAATKQWAESEFPGDAAQPELVGGFEREYRRVSDAIEEIRKDGITDYQRDAHVVELILGDEQYHKALLNPQRWLRNGVWDFSGLESYLKQTADLVRAGERGRSDLNITGKVNKKVTAQVETILRVLMQPRFREVSVYQLPVPLDAANGNLASAVLRQFGVHKNRQLSFEIYPPTEQSDHFARYQRAIIDDCVAKTAGSAH